jgi:DNA ligase 1
MTKTTRLFQQDSKGVLRFWEIEQSGNQYRTRQGILETQSGAAGRVTESKWTVVKGKSIGRSNETTPTEQCEFQVGVKIRQKIEGGYETSIRAVHAAEQTFECMLAAKYDAKKQVFPALSQPKLDGMRCNVTRHAMKSRGGKPIHSAPHIHQAIVASGVFEKYPDAVFDGELYNHHLRDNFEKIISLTRQTKPTQADLEESAKMVEFHCYDFIQSMNDTRDWKARVAVRDEFVYPAFIVKVQTDIVHNRTELDELYGQYLESGYEGQMIREPHAPYTMKRTKSLLKRKEFVDEEFEVVDVIEGDGNRSGMAGRVVLANFRDPGTTFRAGIKGGEAKYVRMLKEKNLLVGKKATIRYQNLSNAAVPRFPVCVAIRDYE